MPSEKKRINLTVPDSVYEKLQRFKENNGIENDASACMQLIVKQLKAQEQSEIMFRFMSQIPAEKMQEYMMVGADEMKKYLDANPPKNQ